MNATIQAPATVTVARRQLLVWGAGVALATSVLTSALGSAVTEIWIDDSPSATPEVEYSEWVQRIMTLSPAEIRAASREPVPTSRPATWDGKTGSTWDWSVDE